MNALRAVSVLLVAATLAACQLAQAPETHVAGITIGDADLGGVVTSADGPEAGVWVIAETMLKIPEPREFAASAGGMLEKVKTQAEWLNVVKTNDCVTRHQMGNKATRTSTHTGRYTARPKRAPISCPYSTRCVTSRPS